MVENNFVSVVDSKRITSLRFLLIVFVIFIHNTYSNSQIIEYFPNYTENLFLCWITYILSEGIARSSVPLFVLFSAYLIEIKNYSYKTLLKKKTVSLVIPFFLWIFVNIFLLYCLQNISIFNKYFTNSNNLIYEWSKIDWIQAFFGFGETRAYPIVYQFWFIRDLMIMVFLYPIINWFYKRQKYLLLFITFMIFLLDINIWFVDSQILFFFVLGMYFAKQGISFFEISDRIKYVFLIIIFIPLIILKKYCEIDILYRLIRAGVIITSSIILLKISSLLIKNPKFFSFLKMLSEYSFFVFALHEPILLTSMKKIWIAIIGLETPVLVTLEYFFISISCVIICLIISIFMKNFLKPIYYVMNGGR